jgi:hypothetical protein
MIIQNTMKNAERKELSTSPLPDYKQCSMEKDAFIREAEEVMKFRLNN